MNSGVSDASLTAMLMRELTVFDSFEEREVATLAAVFRSSHFTKDDTIYEEGSAARGFFIVAEGEVTLAKAVGRSKKPLASLDKGSFFGHLPLIDRGRNATSATAATDCLVLACDRDMFARLASSPSPLALKLMVPLVTACCRVARACDALAHGLYADPRGTLLTLHTS